MEKRTYALRGRVIDRTSNRGVPAVLIEGWDNDEKFDDLLGSAVSDGEGRFTLHFDSSTFADAYRDTDPDVYFKLFFEGAPIASTEKDIIYNFKNSKDEISIPVTPPRRSDGADFLNRMSPELKMEMDVLVKHEHTIVAKLKEPEIAKLFAENPLQALARMEVPVSPYLRQRLKAGVDVSALLKPRSFRLPNGQLITPKVNIRFTDRKEAANVR